MTRALAGLLALAAIALADRAVSMDGIVHEGEVSLDGDTITVVRGKRTYTFEREDFHLVERDDGVHVWSPDFVGRMRGYEFLARARRLAELVDLLKTALAAKSPKLARRVLELAEADGWTGSKAEKARERVYKLERTGPGSRNAARDRKRAEVEARLPDVIHTHARLLAARAELELAKDPRRELGLRILRRALEVHPENEKARALLKRAAPERVLYDARWWLDWHLDLERTGATLPAQDGAELARARRLWRKDLHEIRAGPIRLITPSRDTRVAGRCLAHARLACSVLEGLFAGGPRNKRSEEALTVFLYASREEYLTVSGTGRAAEPRAFLERTTGHYAPKESISRFFWSARPDLERRIASVAVHELTHHWIDKLCPGFADSAAKRGALTPGFWIVEGIATFMEEARYDVERKRWQPFDRRLRSLDVVRALADKQELLPWRRVYTMNQAMFVGLPGNKGPRVVRDWAMGESMISEQRLFYEQAAATCHFLFHAGHGRYRHLLAECVIGHYTSQPARCDVAKLIGMSPERLGQAVVEFARDVGGGWHPTPRAKRR